MIMLLTVGVLGVLLLQCERSDAQEKPAPLYMFTSDTDARETVGVSAGRVDFIKNGEIELEIVDNPMGARAIPVPTYISITPFSFLACIEDMTVNITLTSTSPSLLANPVLSIPTSFVFPTCPFRVFVLYPCNATAIPEGRRVALLTEFRLNAYTHDREFDPIVMYFYKNCDGSAPQEFINATEFPNNPGEHLRVSGNAGCYNDTDLPPKPIIKPSSNEVSPGVIATAVVVPIVILIIIIILVTVLLVWYHKRSRIYEFTIEKMVEAYQTVDNPLFDRVGMLKQAGSHEKEFASEKITFVRELGEGAFGRVYQGMAANIIAGEESTIVAVKQLKLNTNRDEDAALVDFFKEVTFMSKLDHPRIVKLLGVCSVNEPYCMIFEYMDLGDLNSYLRSAIGLGPDCDEVLNKETCFLQLGDLLSIVEQIAEGMEYLSNRNLVHRDLATRNCLVAAGLTVKISDFGLSRDVNTTDYYRVHGRAVLPVRWMAPESIVYGKFTTATDVWSFGVVVWEVFTYGQQPYVGMTNEEVIKFVVITQGTLDPPRGCPQNVEKLMMQCWLQSPGSRPSFSKLFTTIQQLPSILKDVNFDSPDYAKLEVSSRL